MGVTQGGLSVAKSCWHFRWHSSVEVSKAFQFQLLRFGGEGRN